MLILSPIRDAARNEAFTAALDKINARYPKALKKLAEWSVQFFGLQEVLEIHRDQVARYGGAAGIRDLNVLKSAPVFLALNGHDFQAPEDDLAETVLAVARGELGKAEVTVFLRRWTASP